MAARMLLHEITASGAQANPDSVAFRCRDESLTYDKLHTRSLQLANLLVELGVRPGDRVGILSGKTIDLPVAVYGILAAGAAYVPIDPAAPASRVDELIADCGIDVLVSEPNRYRVLRQLASELRTVVGIDAAIELPWPCAGWQQVAALPSTAPAVEIGVQSLAYVIYTSGSTGQPKGIMHSHASALAFARAAAATYALNGADRLSSFPPLHFDQSIFDFYSGPLCGATTVLIPDDVMRFPVNLAALIEEERLTVWYSVPMPLIRMLVDGALDGRDLSSLRWVLYGGETFPAKYLRQLVQRLDNATFSNIYGPAETNQCTYFNFDATSEIPEDGVPIGAPWQWADCRVVDPAAPHGRQRREGELLIHSPTMMRGYWGGRYPEVFVDVYEESQSRRYYRSGDFVRRDVNGVLHFLGRRDRMIKSRGQRIELDDVEQTLNALPDVEEAAVFTSTDADGGTVIYAAVVPKVAQLREKDVVAALTTRLPAAAIPTTIHLLPAFPRTTSGKIDRGELASATAAR